MGAQSSREHLHQHAHHSATIGNPNNNGRFGPPPVHLGNSHNLTALSISSPLPASAFVFPPLGSDQAQLAHQQQLQLAAASNLPPPRSLTGHNGSTRHHHGNNRPNLFANLYPNTEPNGMCSKLNNFLSNIVIYIFILRTHSHPIVLRFSFAISNEPYLPKTNPVAYPFVNNK